MYVWINNLNCELNELAMKIGKYLNDYIRYEKKGNKEKYNLNMPYGYSLIKIYITIIWER